MKTHRTLLLLLALVMSSKAIISPAAAIAESRSAKTKRVHIVVRNDSNQEIVLRCGPEVKAVAPKQAVALTLSEGETVSAEQAFGSYHQGEILVHVSRDLEGDTVGIR